MLEVEHLVQEQHGALGGGEPREHDEERHRDVLDLLEAREAARREVHELGQAIAAALLVSSARARSPSMRYASRAASPAICWW